MAVRSLSPCGGRLSHMEFSNESSLRTQGPIRRGLSLRHLSRGLFSLLRPGVEARGYGSLRPQGRPAERLYEATTASTYGSIQSYAIALPFWGKISFARMPSRSFRASGIHR